MKEDIESGCGDAPHVSIIIPVYNGSTYLREAIDSALAQTYKHIEVIVINDGSNDGGKTEEIAVSYGDKIRYLFKQNGGVATALNLGIREMRGDYFSWLSHDDVYLPSKLAVQVSALKQETDPVVLYGDYYIINAKSEVIGLRQLGHLAAEQFLYLLIASYPVNGCTTLIPRLCFNDVGLFNERLKTTQDYDMWVRLSKKYRFVHMRHALMQARCHPGQGSRITREIHEAEANDFYVRCLELFSVVALSSSEKESAPSRFLSLAKSLKARGWIPASDRAFMLSTLHAADSSIANRYYNRALAEIYKLLPRRLMIAYWKLIAVALRERLISRS
ncbi:MAG: glycosyltransferase [Nitrospirae bacterium]|nr:glycosyltransferase [Nitrospirota bacterium]